jgi:hypothetical protein
MSAFGTSRKWRDVRVKSAMRGITDISYGKEQRLGGRARLHVRLGNHPPHNCERVRYWS